MAGRAPLNLSSPMEDVVRTVANFSEFEAQEVFRELALLP
jgi:hypothetical protein